MTRSAPHTSLDAIADAIGFPLAAELPRPLLEVQFWLMGRDAQHPGGNLLPRLGFVRESPPADRPGDARYRRVEPNRTAILWRSALYVGCARGGWLMHRARPAVAWHGADPPDTYAREDLVLAGPVCPPAQLVPALRWLADYERAVRSLVGAGHRAPPTVNPPRVAPSRPCTLQSLWDALAAACVAGRP